MGLNAWRLCYHCSARSVFAAYQEWPSVLDPPPCVWTILSSDLLAFATGLAQKHKLKSGVPLELFKGFNHKYCFLQQTMPRLFFKFHFCSSLNLPFAGTCRPFHCSAFYSGATLSSSSTVCLDTTCFSPRIKMIVSLVLRSITDWEEY